MAASHNQHRSWRPPYSIIQQLVLVLALTLAPLFTHAQQSAPPGGRANGCSFVYNNTYYIFGGIRPATGETYTPFTSTPLPLQSTEDSSGLIWTAMPMPRGIEWDGSQGMDYPPQFDCARTSDGRFFVIGGPIRFGVMDLQKRQWSLNTLPTQEAGVFNMSFFTNQDSVRTALHSDGTTISIFTGTPPMYHELDTTTMKIRSREVAGIPTGFHGACMTFVPAKNEAYLCGGSNGGSYYQSCGPITLESGVLEVTKMTDRQDGCLLLPVQSGFIVAPGYLDLYRNQSLKLPPTTKSPILRRYNAVDNTWADLSTLGERFLARSFVLGTVIPGTTTAILYGGRAVLSDRLFRDVSLLDMQSVAWLDSAQPVPDQYVKEDGVLPPKPTSTNSTPGKEDEGNPHLGAIIGGAVGGVVLLVITAVAAFYIVRKGQRNSRQPNNQNESHDNPHPPGELLLPKPQADLNGNPYIFQAPTIDVSQGLLGKTPMPSSPGPVPWTLEAKQDGLSTFQTFPQPVRTVQDSSPAGLKMALLGTAAQDTGSQVTELTPRGTVQDTSGYSGFHDTADKVPKRGPHTMPQEY